MEAKTYANIKGARAAAKKAGIDAEQINIIEVETDEGTRYAFAGGATEEQADAPAPALTTVAPAAVKEAAPKVERAQQNGVKRPAPGGVCAAVWDYLDTNPGATVKALREASPANGWNPTNAACEFYAWRKFMGIKGRQPATK